MFLLLWVDGCNLKQGFIRDWANINIIFRVNDSFIPERWLTFYLLKEQNWYGKNYSGTKLRELHFGGSNWEVSYLLGTKTVIYYNIYFWKQRDLAKLKVPSLFNLNGKTRELCGN